MSSQGPLNAGLGGQIGSGTSWPNPNAISGGGTASISLSGVGGSSKLLRATAFGFSIPPSAIIQGITASLTRSDSDSSGKLFDVVIEVLKAGSAVGTNHANGVAWDGSTVLYGGSSDLWGATWTPSDINDTGFGLEISVTNTDGVAHTASAGSLSLTVSFVSGAFMSVIQTG